MSLPPDDRAALIARLRAASCVFAEQEATLLLSQAQSPDELERMTRLRVSGTPLEHVLGWAEFDGSRVTVTPGVFVPRHRSVFLVELAQERVRPVSRVLDLCCGTGALGLALGRRVPGIRIVASDVDPAAVACAQRNLAAVDGQAHVADLFAGLPVGTRFDLVLVNAPYVPTEAIALMPPEARDFEARASLDGGSDGLSLHRRIAQECGAWLAPGAQLIIETSRTQAEQSVRAFTEAGMDARAVQSDERGCTAVVAWLAVS